MRTRVSWIATSLSRFGVIAAIALAACAADEGDDGGGSGLPDGTPTCMAPPAVTYDCEPVPLGTPGSCSGGPALYNDPIPDADKAFPLGCEATLPRCAPAFPNSVQTCFCDDEWTSTPGAIEWVCPL